MRTKWLDTMRIVLLSALLWSARTAFAIDSPLPPTNSDISSPDLVPVLLVLGIALAAALILWRFIANNDLGGFSGDTRFASEGRFGQKSREYQALESVTAAVICINASGKVDYLNPAAETLTGWPSTAARGKNFSEIFNALHPTTRDSINVIKIAHPTNEPTQHVLIHNDGRENLVETDVRPAAAGGGNVVTFHLVNQTINATTAALDLDHDTLTGLLNRGGFEHVLELLLTRTQQEEVWHSLCYLDLDNFKIINDTCGHAAGDQLLRQLPAIIRSCVRNSDVIARLGGDEFAILLENCPLEQAQRIAEKVRKKFSDFKFTWQDRPYTLSASLGIVELSPRSTTAAKALSIADVACFAAKDLGRNRVHVYLASDDESSRRHGEMHMASRITQAHAEDRFTLYHQTIAPLSDHSEGEHFEVLVRMLDEAGQIVPPGAFLPAAERYNLMPTIDRWVIRNTFATVRDRIVHPDGKPLSTVSINLSGASLSDTTLLDYINEQFREMAVPPHVFCFEVTETAAISNLNQAVRFIKELKTRGCRFSLDDFGSGVSSFRYLKNLPVDYLKIDGSFIKDMLNDSTNLAMVQSINEIGHVMGIKTIAEFVETDALLKKLREMGVDYAQGYGVAKPVPFSARRSNLK